MFQNRITHHRWVRTSTLFFVALAFACVAQIAAAQSALAATYYISPNGSDGNNGTSTGSAWKTFEQAWDVLQPGDTLLLLDGTYTESTTGLVQPNIRNGEPGKPITIKALNDGKAVIDGEGEYIPVRLGENWGPHGCDRRLVCGRRAGGAQRHAVEHTHRARQPQCAAAGVGLQRQRQTTTRLPSASSGATTTCWRTAWRRGRGAT